MQLFESINTQYLYYLAREPLSEVICGPHIEKLGNPGLENKRFFN
jgi:hypothetical protein